MTPVTKKEEETKAIFRLKSLYEIAKILGSSLDLKEIYPRILLILSQQMGMKRGGLIFLNTESNEWEMGTAQGLSAEEMKRRKEYFGSGVIPRILEKGQMIEVRDGGETFWFYDPKAKSVAKRAATPFLCAPVKVQGTISGILGIDHFYEDPVPVTEDFSLLGEISTLIGDAIAMRRSIAAENRSLLEENWSFRKELEALGRSVPKTRKRISLTEILEERISRMIAEMKVDPRSNGCLYEQVLSVVERTLLKSSLEKTRHVQLKTARFLGINRNTLRRKIKELGITAAER
ncbi:MAG TPA: helix-turn-helix domain-containing protein [Thermodesulfobacteriota bacterium]|nr:helix-turn-helix domain-containing protein [Thermodesulfobacteriota bacterium]